MEELDAPDLDVPDQIESVYQVDRLSVMYESGMLVVTAVGQTNTHGWTQPQLTYSGGASGQYVFNFTANHPSGIVLQAFSPIASAYSGMLPQPVRITVQAKTNAQVWQPMDAEAST